LLYSVRFVSSEERTDEAALTVVSCVLSITEVLFRLHHQYCVCWNDLIKMDQALNHRQLLLGGLVVGVNFQSSEELVFCAIVLASSSEDMSPDDPVVRAFRLFNDAFADLFDCVGHLALFEFSECPVAVSVVPAVVGLFGLLADYYRLRIELIYIVQEGQVVVGVWMFGVDTDAVFQMVHSPRLVLELEIRECKVVV
jgi:uncharacterized membrane protein YfhO